MKIAVLVDSLRLDLEAGLAAASELGADGVQIHATRGDAHPKRLAGTRRSALKKRLEDLGLDMAAVCGDFGGHGFQISSANPARIDDSKRVMELALDLDCTVVTTHIGVIPPDPSHERYTVLAKACEALGRFASDVGATFAIETGQETAQVLRAFLDDIGIANGLGVNFDPANLVMVFREDIPAAVGTLAPYIVHTHATDGRNLKDVDAEKLYRAFADGAVAGFHADDCVQETPLGEGDVDWDGYLAALGEAGYDGYLTIEREAGPDPRSDVARAVDFLKTLLRK